MAQKEQIILRHAPLFSLILAAGLLSTVCGNCVNTTLVSNQSWHLSEQQGPCCRNHILQLGNVSDTAPRNITISFDGSNGRYCTAQVNNVSLSVITAPGIRNISNVSIYVLNIPELTALSLSIVASTAVSNIQIRLQNLRMPSIWNQTSTFVSVGCANGSLDGVNILMDSIDAPNGALIPLASPPYNTDRGFISIMSTSFLAHNISVVITNCTLRLHVPGKDYDMIYASSVNTSVIFVHVADTDISWIVDCIGVRAAYCDLRPLEVRHSGLISLVGNNSNGVARISSGVLSVINSTILMSVLVDIVPIIYTGLGASVVLMTSQKPKATTGVRIEGIVIRILDSNITLNASEVATVVDVFETPLGVDNCSVLVNATNATLIVRGGAARYRGRSVSVVSIFYHSPLSSSAVVVANMNVEAYVTAGASSPNTNAACEALFCLDSIASADIAEFSTVTNSTIMLETIRMISFIGNGTIFGVSVGMVVYSMSFATVAAAIARVGNSLTATSLVAQDISFHVDVANITLGHFDGLLSDKGSALVLVLAFLINGNVTSSSRLLISNLEMAAIVRDNFREAQSMAPASDFVRQVGLIAFSFNCPSCGVLRDSLSLYGGDRDEAKSLAFFLPSADATMLDTSSLVLTTTKMAVTSPVQGCCQSILVLRPTALWFAPTRVYDAKVSFADVEVFSNPVLPMLVITAVQQNIWNTSTMTVDSVNVTTSVDTTLFNISVPSEGPRPKVLLTIGCNVVNMKPFLSRATLSFLGSNVTTPILSSHLWPNISINPSLPGFQRFRGCVTNAAGLLESDYGFTSPLGDGATSAVSVLAAADAPVLIGVLSSKCGGASQSLGQLFLSPFYALGTAASVWGNIGALLLLVACRAIAAMKWNLRLGRTSVTTPAMTLDVCGIGIPLCPALRFPNWDIAAARYLLQGTVFYAARGVSDVHGTTVDVVAGVVGLVVVGCTCLFHGLLERALLKCRAFRFTPYPRHVRKAHRHVLWQALVPKGCWGPQPLRLALGTLRGSSRPLPSSHRDSIVDAEFAAGPTLYALIVQLLMGLDLGSSSTGCGVVFLFASILALPLVYAFGVSRRVRSRLIGIAHAVYYTCQVLLLSAFSAAMFEQSSANSVVQARQVTIIAAALVSASSAVKMVVIGVAFVWEARQASLVAATNTNIDDNRCVDKRSHKHVLKTLADRQSNLRWLIAEIASMRKDDEANVTAWALAQPSEAA